LNQTAPRFITQESKSVHPWASAEFFRGRATSKYYWSSSGCWRCSATGHSQNALSFLPD